MKRARQWACLGMAIGLLFRLPLAPPAAAQDPPPEDPSRVETAFLRNFAHYVTWPSRAFGNERAPWSICILGSDAFGDVLDKTLQDRTEQGRAFEIFRAKSLEQLPSCQIIFVGYQDGTLRRGALAELKKLPVLTVGNAPEFLQEGGIVRLLIGEHIEMSINLDQARSVSLSIPAKMLEVSREVVENGAVRRWR